MGIVYERRHTKEIAQFGGLAHVMPVYATITLIIFLASMGLPLLNGFIGEFMILQGAFAANRVWAYWAVSGHRAGRRLPPLALPARVLGQDHQRGEPPPRGPQRAASWRRWCPLVVLCFWIGIYPKPFLDFLHAPVDQIAATVQPGLFGPSTVQAATPHGGAVGGDRGAAGRRRPRHAPAAAPAVVPERVETLTVRPSPAPSPRP